MAKYERIYLRSCATSENWVQADQNIRCSHGESFESLTIPGDWENTMAT